MSAAALPAVTPSAPSAARLAWLDALRGIGALAVVAEHLLPWFLPALRPYWFSLGVYGILVFFLVSGYIIPTSLERHGDVRAFWISRFFRLYPLYLAVIALVLALAWWVPVRGRCRATGARWRRTPPCCWTSSASAAWPTPCGRCRTRWCSTCWSRRCS
ncbi:acyltransferase family protein [Nonomuraea rubra]|uniref:acyltransferase family protein n=1 Tax=Nonomuraea rubra TaxID=46180 RepID=UPI00361C97A3